MTIITPVITYASDTWVLKERDKVIFGHTKKREGTWRIKTNHKLSNLIKNKNIINYTETQRLA
jgi:hypothetical protein